MGSMDFGRGRTGRTGRVLAAAGLTAVAWAPTAVDAAPVPPGPVPAHAHASPAPGAPAAPGKARKVITPPHPRGGEERLWLLGGLVAALAATGLVARAALRAHPDL
ncbi:hypothetical protein ACPCSP_10730 [Streptomyces cinereoruber]|uniref:hypothetical protein n=1 Tax=Streptomyces cinereoruber TaxID=67260 RepID=UPI003C2CC2F5